MSGGGRSETIRSYRDLEVWQTAVDVAARTYQFTGTFPRDELYGLTSQMRRVAVSIAANIAEGYGRESTASYIHHLRIAQGSLKELETHIVIAERVGFLSADAAAAHKPAMDSVSRMLRALIRSLEAKS